MAGCLIAGGVTAGGCSDRFSSPGIEHEGIYLFNRSEVLSFTSTVTGEISALTLEAFKTAFKLDVHKNTALYTETLTVSDEAAPFYEQSLTARITATDTTTMTAIEDLVGVDLLIVSHVKNGKFRVIGEWGGVKLTENEYNTGTVAGDAVGDTLVFTGQANGKSRFFFDTDEATTLATLDAYL